MVKSINMRRSISYIVIGGILFLLSVVYIYYHNDKQHTGGFLANAPRRSHVQVPEGAPLNIVIESPAEGFTDNGWRLLDNNVPLKLWHLLDGAYVMARSAWSVQSGRETPMCKPEGAEMKELASVRRAALREGDRYSWAADTHGNVIVCVSYDGGATLGCGELNQLLALFSHEHPESPSLYTRISFSLLTIREVTVLEEITRICGGKTRMVFCVINVPENTLLFASPFGVRRPFEKGHVVEKDMITIVPRKRGQVTN